MLRRKKKPEEVYEFLAIKVEDYDLSTSIGVNHVAYDARYGMFDEDDPLYPIAMTVKLFGTCIDPPKRAGDKYEVELIAREHELSRNNLTLKDVQKRGEFGVPVYRDYRGTCIPVYEKPPELGFLEKVRGEAKYSSYLFLDRRFLDGVIHLLYKKPMYMCIDEVRVNRRRRVRKFYLQTENPVEE